MKAAVLALFLAALLYSAETIPETPALSENLQLLSFTVSPQQIFPGESALFSFSVESIGDSVSSYHASITIQDSSGAQIERLDFFDATIAGGERQSLSKPWGAEGLASGNYSALVNITEVGAQPQILLAAFEILPSAQGAAAGTRQAASREKEDCGSPINCGEWGACDGNYTTQQCEFSSCPQKPFFYVQSCASQQGSQLEKEICSSYSFLCTSSPSEQSPVYFCLPILLMLLLLLLFAFRKARQRSF